MEYAQIAKAIATAAHFKQLRRDGVTPYIVHPEEVVRRIQKNKPGDVDDYVISVAWLHDVLEDTRITADELLRLGIPKTIVNAVVVLTKTGKDYNKYINDVKGDILARIVKIADMEANLADDPTEQQIEKYTKALAFLKN